MGDHRMHKNAWLLKIWCYLIVSLTLFGCTGVLDYALKDTADPEVGAISLEGIKEKVLIRRDDFGVPLIEASNFNDLAFGTGYAMASDRLAQMVSYSLLGQGRLSEMAGRLTLDIDMYVRTLGIPETASRDYEALSDELKSGLDAFSKGVNAYIGTHKDRLPLDFKISGYMPAPWQPEDSLYIAHALNLGLSFNASEEIAFLNIAKAVGPHKAAWLIPVYPDEPLSFGAADALDGLDFKKMGKSAETLSDLHRKINQYFMQTGIPASNNWAIAPAQTKEKASIIANDTHLPLEQPCIWMMIHMKSPEYEGAGIAIAGVPCIIAGFNGHVAWGETMVMGDTQDLFIEKLKTVDGKEQYLYKDKWYPVTERKEIFKIKGEKDVVKTVRSTRHGPLINSALAHQPKNIALPPQIEFPYGLAMKTDLSEPSQSFNAMFDLTRASTMEQARQAISGVRFMALNFIYGNKDHIAWQVSGRYPIRKSGRGHFPVPGWTGEYDWTGYVDVDDQPYIEDPASGFLGSANHRSIPADSKLILSSTWYAPERYERIMKMLNDTHQHTWKDSVRMQYDRDDLFVAKLQRVLFESHLTGDILKEMDSWKDKNKAKDAKQAFEMLKAFDGVMSPESGQAALFGVFRNVFVRDVFFDELGPENSAAWISFKTTIQGFYGADQDHLLDREDSPFWDDVATPEKETKAQILARVLAGSMAQTKQLLGKKPDDWKWGELLNYQWQTQTTQMSPFLSFWERFAVRIISGYTDRGPYPAGGNFNTVNVAGFHKGDDFNVWLVPAMRLVVDFGLDEPMFLTICGGQSGNPVSVHYDDGIPLWLNGDTRPMPFQDEHIREQYSKVYLLEPKNQ